MDRHSGWIVAVPERKVGLTGAKVALSMVQYQWRPFKVPWVITSDQGSKICRLLVAKFVLCPGGALCVLPGVQPQGKWEGR